MPLYQLWFDQRVVEGSCLRQNARELSRNMLAIGRAAPIATQHQLAAGAKALGNRPPHRDQVAGRRFGVAPLRFGARQQVVPGIAEERALIEVGQI